METHKPFFIDHFAAYYKSNYNDNWPPLPRIIIIQKEMFSPRAASTEYLKKCLDFLGLSVDLSGDFAPHQISPAIVSGFTS